MQMPLPCMASVCTPCRITEPSAGLISNTLFGVCLVQNQQRPRRVNCMAFGCLIVGCTE